MNIAKYPLPETCPYCGGKVKLVSNATIYGKAYGNVLCYSCEDCDAYVGTHPDGVTPLGRLANQKLRGLKIAAHNMFDPVWKRRKVQSRAEAYTRLSLCMKIPLQECHFGWFDEEQLLRVIEILKQPDWYQIQGEKIGFKLKGGK